MRVFIERNRNLPLADWLTVYDDVTVPVHEHVAF